MLVSNDYVKKQDVVYVTESDSKEDALKKLEESGYRCIPVLDDSAEYYAGNIYKVNLLEQELKGPLEGTVKDLIEDKDGAVKEDDPFFKVFSSIKRLPYLAMVDESEKFRGILTSGNVITVLENAWGVNDGSYSLTIGTVEFSGALRKMLKIVNKYCNVQSVVSLNNGSYYVRRVCIVLPNEVDEPIVEKVKSDLEKNNFTVTHIEKLN
ncbi:cyclic di-AMP binding protein CbpA [Virgibacillus kekensis]|uniref:Cyclic di-AMP binding protein CbpA n=1 Tax=Virgibacillus kekensis TaxID=202261 RepID=A0ABV9DIP9_9BACI